MADTLALDSQRLMRTDPNQKSELDESVTKSPDSQDDESILSMVRDCYEEGKNARAAYDSDWQKREEFYRDNQWDRLRAAYKSKPVLNIIRQTIQSTIPILTDSHPGINILPREPTDFEFSKILNDLVTAWWDAPDNGVDHTIVELITDSMIYDFACAKVTWDQDRDSGMGEVTLEPVNPNDIYVPYGARDFTKDCSWVLQRSVKTVGYLKKKFPDAANKIKSDSWSQTVMEGKIVDKSAIQLVSPTDKKSFNIPNPDANNADSRKTCEVWELWMESDEVEEKVIDAKDENGRTETIQQLKYPRGCVITILPNLKVVLQKTENPYKHARFPFVRLVDHILPRKFEGEGETKVLMPQQRIINRVLSNIIDYNNLAANPIWITEQGNGVDSDRLTNQIGGVLQVGSGKLNTIKRDIPPALQAGASELLATLLRQAEMISGVNEVSQGRKPSGITAAQAIESLQEASNTRIRLKERNLNVSLSQIGWLIVQLMMQFYTTPRVVRLTNKEQGWPQYFEFFTEHGFTEHGEDGSMTYNKKEWQHDEASGQYKDPGQYQSGQTKGIVDVKILSGTSLPFAKTQRSNIAFKLFEDKVIDAKELLETLEWPNTEAILSRQQEQQQAMAAQQGAGQPPPAQPPQAM